MDATPIRPAYSSWPAYNQRLRDAVAGLTAGQLAIAPSPDRWPLWATLGQVACQRVFAHDMYHAGQVVQTLGIAGLRKPDLWG